MARLIDADRIDVRKWFTDPALIQRIQAMLDDAPTTSDITLRELLASCRGETQCAVWLNEVLAMRYFSCITGTAATLLHRQDIPMLGCKVFSATAEGSTLVIQLDDEED